MYSVWLIQELMTYGPKSDLQMGFLWPTLDFDSKILNLQPFKTQDVSHKCLDLQLFFFCDNIQALSPWGNHNLELATIAL